MDLNKLEQDINAIVRHLNKDSFIYQFLLAYGFPKATITRLQKGSLNKSKNKDDVNQEILWKSLFFRVEEQQDLHVTIDEAQKDPIILKQHPRFMIVTNFKTLLAVDTKIGDSLDIPLTELSNNYAFFLPWAGMEKTQIQSLNLADVKAAEKLAQLYDIIIQDNHIESDVERHGLNIFLSRLLFCFFAEDTGIFDDDQFTNAIASHTQKDGSDCQEYLIALFKVLNVEKRSNEPTYLKAFPYVNGGLFEVDFPAPKLNAKARKLIINSGTLNWKQINPDIFGSMMQAVVHSDQRGSLGMHYTSVANIMKVIEPLFLNDLKEQLEKAEGNENKLTKLIDRIYHLRLFDPACGSGNFLIIAYKELCKVQIEIFEQLRQINPDKWNIAISGIRLTQFYGIELDDFAHETAKLSLWLAEHQMNLAFKSVFGMAKPTLPLQEGGHIICGNATRLDWEVVCPKDEGAEIYILGNPPFRGKKEQTNNQKLDLAHACKELNNYKNLDFISSWFVIAAKYISVSKIKCAFVSTNSICQGEQVGLLWPYLYKQGLEIFFAYTSFMWKNSAKNNAGVAVIIIGLQIKGSNTKTLYITSKVDQTKYQKVLSINPYLSVGSSTIVKKRSTPLSNISEICNGSMPNDGGHFFKNKNQYELLEPEIKKYYKKVIGAREFFHGIRRYTLWLDEANLNDAIQHKEIKKIVHDVKLGRKNSTRKATQKLAEVPFRYGEVRFQEGTAIIIPGLSAEKRKYIPIGFITDNTIVTNLAQVIYNSEPWLFGVLASRINNCWVRSTSGYFKKDIRYSPVLSYNTFPFPEISEAQKTTLEDHVFNVLDEREQHSEKTMAELYDPDKMPEGLRQAHHEMDLAVEQCYRKKPFKSDEERLEYLFKLYEEMIEAEKGEK